MNFLDLFSRQASTYAAARPSYPDELYEFIASLVPRRRLAWDCATGNGQAACDLARYFERVIATDASADQIARAVAVPNVEYRVAPASASGIPAQSVDLVAVAQALHWFATSGFFSEVRRVTVDGGIVAAWCYGYCHAGHDLEAEIRAFEEGTLAGHWRPERRFVAEGYRTIPFPFDELPGGVPSFELRMEWSLRQLGEYINSWSAVASYRRAQGVDPVAPFLERLAARWGSPDRTRQVTWPLDIRVGTVRGGRLG